VDKNTWLSHNAKILERKIAEFNEKAEEVGVDVIVAFRMTTKERDEFLEEVMNDNDAE
jgi:hypothetical protein